MQLDWKKLRTTQSPLRRDRSNDAPSISVPVAVGAGLPIRFVSAESVDGFDPASTTNNPAITRATAMAMNGARRRPRISDRPRSARVGGPRRRSAPTPDRSVGGDGDLG